MSTLRVLLAPDGGHGQDGDLGDEALEAFYLIQDVRHTRANLVVSTDGRAAVASSSEALSSDADRRVLRALRSLTDVLLVGAGTARDEGYGVVPLAAGAGDRRAARGQEQSPRPRRGDRLVRTWTRAAPAAGPAARRRRRRAGSTARPPVVLTCEAGLRRTDGGRWLRWRTWSSSARTGWTCARPSTPWRSAG